MPKVFHLILNPKSIEYYKDILNYITGLKSFQYLRCCEHVGQSEQHYHMFVQFTVPINKLSVKKLHGAHIIPRDDNKYPYGSNQAILNYVNAEDEEHKKENVTAILIDEIGEYKQQGGHHSVKHLLEIEKEEDLPDYKMYNIWKKLKYEHDSDANFREMLQSIKDGTLKGPDIIYFIGKPGNGKTYNGYKYALSHYDINDITKVTINNNFFKFTGNSNAKCLVLEEFRQSQLHPSSLLQFTDKYGYEAPIKGGHAYVRPECIIISSIIHPRKLYSEHNEELNEQFIRRITHLYEVDYDHNYKEIDINNKTIEDMYIYNCNLNNQVYLGGLPISGKSNRDRINELKNQYNIK